MERTNLRKLIVFLVLIALGLLGSNTTSGQNSPSATIEDRAIELRNLLDTIEGISEEPPRIHVTKDGYLRFIMAPPSTHFAVEPTGRGTPQEAASAFLEGWRDVFVNESPAISFDTIRVKTSDSRTYLRLQQMYAGLEVYAAQMMVQVNAGGGVFAVMSDVMRNSQVVDTGEVSLRPSIDALTAQRAATEWSAGLGRRRC